MDVSAKKKPLDRADTAVVGLAVVGIGVCVWLTAELRNLDPQLTAAISAVGSLSSVVGLVIVLIQVAAIRTASAAAAKASEDTRLSISALMAIADVSKTIKLIEQLQSDVGAGRYEVARIRLQDVRANLVYFQPSIARLGNDQLQKFERLLTNTSIDLTNLYDAIHGTGKQINATKFSRSMEELIALLLTAERVFTLEA